MNSIKSQTPKVVTTSVAPSDAFKQIVVAAKTISEASMAFVAAGVAYLLNTCHLQAEKDRDTIKDARKAIIAELEREKGNVQDQMLVRYVQVMTSAFNDLTDGKKAFGSIVQTFAGKTTAKEGADYLLGVFTKDWGCKSMNALREHVGIAVGAQNSSKKKPIAKRAEMAVTNIARALDKKGKGALTPARREAALPQVAAAVANALPVDTLVDTIIQSLNRLAGIDRVTPAQIKKLADVATSVVAELTAKVERLKQVQRPKARALAPAKAVTAAKAKAPAKAPVITAH